MKFVVDFMLGRLCRWLRLLGYDAVYCREKENIITTSLRETRIVLTRNQKLSRRKSYRLILLASDSFREQLAQIIGTLNLAVDENKLFSRCVHCNAMVKPAKKDEVKGKVPPFIYDTHNDFSVCPVCQRIYWKGSHWNLMKRDLERIVQ